MSFTGACHCGAVTFTIDADLPARAVSCNCSHCRAKGLLLSFFPASQFTLHSGEGALAEYLFNKHRIRHQFCATCGVQPFAYGTDKDGNDVRAVNLRAVAAVDIDALELQKVDGASF